MAVISQAIVTAPRGVIMTRIATWLLLTYTCFDTYGYSTVAEEATFWKW